MTNDWIEWRGGSCPVNENAIVEIKLRDNQNNKGRAGRFVWSHSGSSVGSTADIVAFRFADDYDGDDTVKWKEQNYCPVPPDTVIEVILESGLKDKRRAGATIWDNQDSNPILSFRIIKDKDTQDVKEKKKQNIESLSRINDVLWGCW